ncbi:CHAT domain-containing protein [Marinilabiliaceae bacterium ANBcel2]|nr:CHAT domain-containing protein [Marinilabiliaceae bacterium ANBcel2]
MLKIFTRKRVRAIILLFYLLCSIQFVSGQYFPFYSEERNLEEYSYYQKYLDIIDRYNNGDSYSDLIKEMDTFASSALEANDGKQYLFFKNEVANLYRHQSKFHEAYDVLDESMNVFKMEYDTIHMEYLVSIRLYRATLNTLLHQPDGFEGSHSDIGELFQAQFELLDLLNDEGEPLRNTLVDYGLYLLREDNLDESIQTLYKARQLALKADDLASLAVADYTIMANIDISYDLKETQIEVLKNDIALFESGTPSLPILFYNAFFQSKVSYNYFHDFDNTERAIYFAEKSAALLDTLRYPAHHIRASTHGNLALYYSNKDDTAKVWHNTKISRDILANEPITHANRVLAYLLIAEAAIPFSTDSVFEYLSIVETLQGAESFQDKIMEIESTAYFEKGNYSKAKQIILSLFDDYSEIAGHKVPKISSTVSYVNQLKFLNILEKIYRVYELEQQYQCSSAVVALIELQNQLFHEVVAEDIFGFEPTGLARIYNDFLERSIPYMLAGEREDFAEDAFEMAFASKSLQLNNLMAKKRFQTLLEKDTDLFESLLNSSFEVQSSRNRLASASPSNSDEIYLKKMDLNNSLIDYFMLRHQIDDLYKSGIKREFQESINIASLEDIQSRLGENEAFLEFFVMDNSWGQIAVLQDTTISFYYEDVDLSSKIERERYSLLTGRASTDLGTLLFENIYPHLENINNLIVIPDKDLNSIPIEALIVDDKFLIEDFSVSYSYSATLWYNLRKDNSFVPPQNMLTIAPMVSDYDDYEMQVVSSGYRGGEELEALPFSLEEIKGIGAIMHSTLSDVLHLYAGDASFYNVKNRIEEFDIVHFATHGIVNPDNPERSGLYLYQKGEYDFDHSTPSFLSLGDLYNMNLGADLVVLSSCNTGHGRYVAGEGEIALPRGFILSGVPSVVATLWRVHDERTKDVMLLFYEYVAKGYNYREALRQAKLEVIEKGFLPMDWSGLIIIGR